ncbi:MAG: nucleotidyltransferase domain-containing protein [Thermomicrobiales bacterium]
MAEPMTITDLPPIIREHLDAIVALARAYEVERLEVFGSVMTDRFDPDRSDIDFLVEMQERGALDDFRRYVGLEEALGGVLDSSLDLILADALRRESFRIEAAKTRRVIYDAAASR